MMLRWVQTRGAAGACRWRSGPYRIERWYAASREGGKRDIPQYAVTHDGAPIGKQEPLTELSAAKRRAQDHAQLEELRASRRVMKANPRRKRIKRRSVKRALKSVANPSRKNTETMTGAELNRELDRLDRERIAVVDALIKAGRGDESFSDIAKKSDTLSRRWQAESARRADVRAEITRRYGPDAPSRLPRGFHAAKASRAKKNPAASSRQARIAQAGRLFRDFRGENPGRVDVLTVPAIPDVVLQVGECIGIMYRTKRDGQVDNYLHRFVKKARPTLAVSSDGRILYLLGGAYRVTDRGIVDDA